MRADVPQLLPARILRQLAEAQMRGFRAGYPQWPAAAQDPDDPDHGWFVIGLQYCPARAVTGDCRVHPAHEYWTTPGCRHRVVLALRLSGACEGPSGGPDVDGLGDPGRSRWSPAGHAGNRRRDGVVGRIAGKSESVVRDCASATSVRGRRAAVTEGSGSARTNRRK